VDRRSITEYLIRSQERGARNFNPQSFCRLEIDDQLELGRLLDRKIVEPVGSINPK
jgi:hypothetical protein